MNNQEAWFSFTCNSVFTDGFTTPCKSSCCLLEKLYSYTCREKEPRVFHLNNSLSFTDYRMDKDGRLVFSWHWLGEKIRGIAMMGYQGTGDLLGSHFGDCLHLLPVSPHLCTGKHKIASLKHFYPDFWMEWGMGSVSLFAWLVPQNFWNSLSSLTFNKTWLSGKGLKVLPYQQVLGEWTVGQRVCSRESRTMVQSQPPLGTGGTST